MKKFIFLILGVVLCAACSDTNDIQNKEPSCKITSPIEGDEVLVNTPLTVKWTAEDEDGTIEKIMLIVGDETITDIAKTAKEYTIPAEKIVAGPLKIKLTVTDNMNASTSAEVNVNVVEKLSGPTCKITSPANGASFIVTEEVTIEGTAASEEGTIKTVTLKLNGKTVEAVSSVPFSYTVPQSDKQVGEMKVILEVEDSNGLKRSDEITIELLPEPGAPTCRITAPSDGAEIRITDEIIVKGVGESEESTIEKVTLTIGGKKVGAVTTVPFEYTVTEQFKEVGELDIILEVEDANGKSNTDKVTVTVLPELIAPECEITSPQDGAQLWISKDITVEYTATDEDGSIAKATLKYGDREIPLSDFISPVNIPAADLSLGELTIELSVEDNDGLTSNDRVTVNIIAAPEPPTVELILPLDGVTYASGEILVKGNGATNIGTITGVTLKVGENTISEVTSVPFTYTLPEASLPTGNVKVSLTLENTEGGMATAESNIIVEQRSGTMTDSRDNKIYKTIEMGTQVWMAENLAYLPSVNTWSQGSDKVGSENDNFYYVFANTSTDVEVAKANPNYVSRGVLYNWNAAVDGNLSGGDAEAIPSGIQSVCPDGWHLPSKAEFNKMIEWVKDQIPDQYAYGPSELKNVAGALRLNTEWTAYSSANYPQLELGGLNIFGFNAHPSGVKLSGLGFDNENTYVFFWTTDKPYNPGYVAIPYNNYNLTIGYHPAPRGHSVRCIKD